MCRECCGGIVMCIPAGSRCCLSPARTDKSQLLPCREWSTQDTDIATAVLGDAEVHG